MGFIYKAMDETKEKIQVNFGCVKKRYISCYFLFQILSFINMNVIYKVLIFLLFFLYIVIYLYGILLMQDENFNSTDPYMQQLII
jgi:hypothetical protein